MSERQQKSTTNAHGNRTRRVLVTGSTGMLGKDIIDVLADDPDVAVFGFDKFDSKNLPAGRQVTGDLTDFSFVEQTLARLRPDCIIHCAAIVDVDACEKNRNVADLLHAESTRVLSSYRPDVTRFVYICTDAVFDGEKGSYSEHDMTHPINHYGLSKLQGELIALKMNGHTVSVRTNIYGFHSPPGKSLVEWAIDKLGRGEQITGFADIMFNPVYTKQLARAISRLIKVDYSGVLHIAGQDICSKYNFLLKLAEVFDFDRDLVKPGSVSAVNFVAQRPMRNTLNTDLFQNTFRNGFHLREGLLELKEDYQNCFGRDTLEKNKDRVKVCR